MMFSLGFIYLVARLARQLMKERGMSCMHVKSLVNIFSGSFGSFGSVVDKRTRNNLHDVKSWVHIFCSSFGLFGSAVDESLSLTLTLTFRLNQ